jgi:hypothetical protein
MKEEQKQFTLILPLQPQLLRLTVKFVEVVMVALGKDDSCLITFYSHQSLTDYTREMTSTIPMEKDQDSAKNLPQ